MISYPTIQTNAIGGSSSISFTSVSSLNDFIKQAAVENLLLQGLTIYAPGNFAQLSQPITLTSQQISGNASQSIITPIVDPYQSTAILKNINTNGFILDGLSSIGYNILPNTQVQFILTVIPNKGIGSISSYKNQSNAVDTFDLIANSGEMPQEQIYEPEEKPSPSIKDQLLDINNKTSEAQTESKVAAKPKSKDEVSKGNITFNPLLWIVPAVIIAYLLFEDDKI
jgi:hypothetical protein